MDIEKPTDAELAALLAEHAHRYPQKARFTVADGDGEVTLPVLLGNPSGACKMPSPDLASPAWDMTVAATFKMRPDAQDVAEQLAADCVLWPNAAVWASWTRRWPALPEITQAAVRRICGGLMAMIEEPRSGDPKPEALAPVFDRCPGAVWRRLRPTSDTLISAVIAPPDFGVWRMFVEAMKRREAEHARLARELATSCLRAAVDAAGGPVDADTLFGRWPGQVLLVGLEIAHLAGITAKYAVGEW